MKSISKHIISGEFTDNFRSDALFLKKKNVMCLRIKRFTMFYLKNLLLQRLEETLQEELRFRLYFNIKCSTDFLYKENNI